MIETAGEAKADKLYPSNDSLSCFGLRQLKTIIGQLKDSNLKLFSQDDQSALLCERKSSYFLQT